MNKKIAEAINVLKSGGIILYPTDTVWGIGCDATNYQAVEKIFKLKKREDSKSMIVLVDTPLRLQNLVEVPALAWDLMDFSEKPLTIIYDNPKNVAGNIILSDNTLAVRLVSLVSVRKIINSLNAPLVSTSANLTGRKTPKSFSDIDQEIIKGVDYVLDIPFDSTTIPSTIIKLTSDLQVKIIRK